jgi:hypothetical protein
MRDGNDLAYAAITTDGAAGWALSVVRPHRHFPMYG